ncbi:MAG: DUF308 domain-containing protein [Clostridia bacterium]|nr:DUF308 domain-containing protein [Clostridia bacterium]
MQQTNNSRSWIASVILGALVVVLGFFMIRNPLVAFETLSTLFLVNFLVIGVAQFVSVIIHRNMLSCWGLHLILPGLMIFAGLTILTTPFAKESMFCVFAGAGVLIEGISTLTAASFLKKSGLPGGTAALVLGVLLIVLGLITISDIFFTIRFVNAIASVAVLLSGVGLIAGGLTMRKFNN